MSVRCQHCDIQEYTGGTFKFIKNIDGGHQHFEVFIYDSPEDECFVLSIDGTFTELRIPIYFCPHCGCKL